jgi:hypothetical protein
VVGGRQTWSGGEMKAFQIQDFPNTHDPQPTGFQSYLNRSQQVMNF